MAHFRATLDLQTDNLGAGGKGKTSHWPIFYPARP
jgi:hypothetical protein